GSCDACLHPKETFDATVIAQKIVSAILKTGERFGMNHVIDVLKGSKSQTIQDRGHAGLSVFGIVDREYSKNQLQFLVRQMISRSLLEKTGDEYPTLTVTAKGRQWLKERASLSLSRPPESTFERPTKTKEPIGDYDRDLFERLRTLRKRLADEKGVPPFIIFGNTSLIEMANRSPITPDDFLTITGVGKEKLARFGEVFMNEIRAYAKKKQSP
ncbi:MAG: RQC domain-containing protein, partial [bacterium]|nr:RQC domain-containing protein [bacterium]